MRLRYGAAVALAALVAVVATSTWIGAQLGTVAVLATVDETPLLEGAVSALTREPSLVERTVAGVPVTEARPAGAGPWPAVVLVNGVTPRGRFHPRFRSLAVGFARAGYLVLVPDPPGLAVGELTEATVGAIAAVAGTAASLEAARNGRVSLIGISAGGSLALLAAVDARVAERVRVVCALAPYVELVDVVRLATTGVHEVDGTLVRYDVSPFVGLVTARSLAAALPQGRDRNLLLGFVRRIPDDHDDPLGLLQRTPLRLGDDGGALLAVLRNRDPQRFPRLWSALPSTVRRTAEALSPIEHATELPRLELLSAPEDKYFPPAESRALVRAAPEARVTISRTLQHADLELSLEQLGDLARLDGFAVRCLREAAFG